MIDIFKQHLQTLNSSKFLAGLAMITVNIGSKYIEFNFSKSQEAYIRHAIGREILIFAMVFMGTQNLLLSLGMTAAFIILADYAFNEKSKLCVLPEKYKKLHTVLDTNKDSYVSQKEIDNAVEILTKARKHNQRISQLHLFNNMQNNK